MNNTRQNTTTNKIKQNILNNFVDIQKAEFTEESRKKLSKKKQALPGGSFPIRNVGDLKNAIQAVGRAKNYEQAKHWIIKRAKALSAEKLLPEDWVKKDGIGELQKCSEMKNLKKALEFSRTEGEIFNSLDNKIQRLADSQMQIEKEKSEIVSTLAVKPDSKRKYWRNNYDGVDNQFYYPVYKCSYDGEEKVCFSEMCLVDNIGENIELLKNRYNDISRNYFNLEDKIIELKRMINNLSKDSKKKINLNMYELEQFGF